MIDNGDYVNPGEIRPARRFWTSRLIVTSGMAEISWDDLDDGDALESFSCSCCAKVLWLTRTNFRRIVKAAAQRYPELVGRDGTLRMTFDVSYVPDDVDLTKEVDDATILRVVTLAVNRKQAVRSQRKRRRR